MTDYIAKFGRYMEAERRCSASTVDIYTRDLRGFEAYMRESGGSDGKWLDPAAVALEDVRDPPPPRIPAQRQASPPGA